MERSLSIRLPFVLIFLALASHGASPNARELEIELEVRDVVPIETTGTHAVVLVSKDSAVLLPIFVSEESAVSIAFRLAERNSPHPLAADLLDDTVQAMGGRVTEVRIDDIQGDVYTSHVVIRQGRKDLRLNARPSDAIALALSGNARILCAMKVIHSVGITRDELETFRKNAQPGVGGSGPEGTLKKKLKVVPPTPSIQL